MATSDFRSLLASAREPLPAPTWLDATDLGRFGLEAMTEQEDGDARALRSSGALRLHGAGVRGNSVDLEDVGLIARHWQRTVTAYGAAIEGIKSARGRVPADIANRTRLSLTGSPGGGSLVLRIEPVSCPLAEVEPDGHRPLVGVARPLADEAAEGLIGLIKSASMASLEEVDSLSSALQDLGPRVAASLRDFAATVESANVSLDVSWREPSTPTVCTTLSVEGARWLSVFIEGRDLASEDETISGIAETISNRERWLISTADGLEKIRASNLDPVTVRRVRAGDFVTIKVRTWRKLSPDGGTSVRREALELVTVSDPPVIPDSAE